MGTNNSIKWFGKQPDSGRFGQLGWATPYVAQDKFYSNNNAITSLVNKAGELWFSIMQQPDVNVSTPPKIFYLRSVGKMIDRLNTIIATETVPDGTVEDRTVSVNPTQEEFLIYPVPYFRVRNRWIKRWDAYVLMALGEAMKHQDNQFSLQLHPDLAGIILMYTNMIYTQIATQFLGVPLATAQTPGFQITDAMYAAYQPNAIFLASERVDTGAPVDWDFSTEDLAPLAQGVPASVVFPYLLDWPTNMPPSQPPSDPNTLVLPPADTSVASSAGSTDSTAGAVSAPAITPGAAAGAVATAPGP